MPSDLFWIMLPQHHFRHYWKPAKITPLFNVFRPNSRAIHQLPIERDFLIRYLHKLLQRIIAMGVKPFDIPPLSTLKKPETCHDRLTKGDAADPQNNIS
jgi:hypothetical protein